MNATIWTTRERRGWSSELSGLWKWLRIVFGFIASGDENSGSICSQFGPRTTLCQSRTIGVRECTDVQTYSMTYVTRCVHNCWVLADLTNVLACCHMIPSYQTARHEKD